MIDISAGEGRDGPTLTVEIWYRTPLEHAMQHTFRTRAEARAFLRRFNLLCQALFPLRQQPTLRTGLEGDDDDLR